MHSHYDHLIELRHAGKYAELRVAECSVGQVSLLPPLDWREKWFVGVGGWSLLICALSLCRFILIPTFLSPPLRCGCDLWLNK